MYNVDVYVYVYVYTYIHVYIRLRLFSARCGVIPGPCEVLLTPGGIGIVVFRGAPTQN